MATVVVMSLGSRAAVPGALRGRRAGSEANRVRIGYRSRAVASAAVRQGAVASRDSRSAGRSIKTHAVVNTAVMNLPGMAADGHSDERRLEGSGSVMALSRGRTVNALSGSGGGDNDVMNDFMNGKLPGKIATILGLLIVSRIGTYIPISGVDRAAFAESLQGGGSVLGYVDTLTGGSISKLGIFSLGIVPYINSSIIFQVRAGRPPSPTLGFSPVASVAPHARWQ